MGGLDQYRSYLAGVAHGDFGWSISQNQPVGRLMRQRMPWTLLLTGEALLVSSAISFFAGVTAAWNRNRLGDRALIIALSAARAIPEYAIGATAGVNQGLSSRRPSVARRDQTVDRARASPADRPTSPFARTIALMSEQPVTTFGKDPGETPSAAAHSASKRIRRTMMSTGFSGVAGKTCKVCGFQGFRWQTECPDGHPLV